MATPDYHRTTPVERITDRVIRRVRVLAELKDRQAREYARIGRHELAAQLTTEATGLRVMTKEVLGMLRNEID